MVSKMSQMDLENRLVLELVQSLNGRISTNVLAVAVEVLQDDSAKLYFALDHECQDDLDDIHEIPAEIAGQLGRFLMPIHVDVQYGSNWVEQGWRGLDKRRVFSAKRNTSVED
jgi:hypothetical protein